MNARDRKRLKRQRRRNGVQFVIPIAFYEDAIAALIDRGELLEEEVKDRRTARVALEDLLNDWALRGR